MKNLEEFVIKAKKTHGVCFNRYIYLLSSEWISGRGRHISKRAVPKYAKVIELEYIFNEYSNIPKRLFGLIVERHPRAKRVIYIDLKDVK